MNKPIDIIRNSLKRRLFLDYVVISDEVANQHIENFIHHQYGYSPTREQALNCYKQFGLFDHYTKCSSLSIFFIEMKMPSIWS